MKTTKKLFSCPHEVLYTVCLLVYAYVRTYLAQFKAFKSMYTDEYIANALKAVEAAKSILDVNQRNADAKEKRDALQASAALVRGNWQQLKSYIKTAYPGTAFSVNLQKAGSVFYAKAGGKNWSALRSLIETADTYLSNNRDQLMANNNMPSEFESKFNDEGKKCLELCQAFMDAEMQKSSITIDKNAASNAVYTTLTNVLFDGQRVFSRNPSVKNLFIFSKLVSIAKGKSPASFKGFIYHGNKLPVIGAIVQSGDGTYKAVTDKRGRFIITQMSAGPYTFTITAATYQPVDVSVTLTPGTAKHLNFTLVTDTAQQPPQEALHAA